MIGTGDEVENLRTRARDLGIEHDVSWAGWLTGGVLNERLASADVAVSLDDDDEFSRLSTMTKVPEYLACGLACIVSDLPENRVTAGDAAVYFPAGDHHELAKQLELLLDEPARVHDLRAAAAERAQLLLWEHSAARLVAAYAWMLDGGPAVPGEQRIEP
jgi:glycosyltransferase involved in cell wall biosynthesis